MAEAAMHMLWYGDGERVARSLRSLCAAAPPSVALTLWDNGSTEAGQRIVKRASTAAAAALGMAVRLRQLSPPADSTVQYRVGRARNRMLLEFDRAEQPGLWILADDDVDYLPGWLDACARVLEAWPEVGLVSPYRCPRPPHEILWRLERDGVRALAMNMLAGCVNVTTRERWLRAGCPLHPESPQTYSGSRYQGVDVGFCNRWLAGGAVLAATDPSMAEHRRKRRMR